MSDDSDTALEPCGVDYGTHYCSKPNQKGWLMTIGGWIPVCEDCYDFYEMAFPHSAQEVKHES